MCIIILIVIAKCVIQVKSSSLPDPFLIPTFRAATEKNLSLKRRADSDRKYYGANLSHYAYDIQSKTFTK